MYQTETHGIRISVTPRFMEGESAPERDHYFWAYTIEIVNLSARTAQLMTRHWLITDGFGRLQVARGEGVVGKQPVLRPGESFSYTSGCPLGTPHGSMRGYYAMRGEDGMMFDVEVPLFALDSPYVKKVLH